MSAEMTFAGAPYGCSGRILRRWARKGDKVVIGYTSTSNLIRDPALALTEYIRAGLRPRRQPAPVKTLADMTPEERAEMAALYGPIKT